MRKDVRCYKCSKMIAKMDDDGTVHIRSGRRMPQVIASGRVMLICPNEVLRPMEAPISCGGITVIDKGVIDVQERRDEIATERN